MVFEVSPGITPITIWESIHAELNHRPDRLLVDLLKPLSFFPGTRWAMICEGVGWTHLGAIALSWCKDVTIENVLEAWDKACKDTALASVDLKLTFLLNPALLPEAKLSHIINIGNTYRSVWLLLGAYHTQGTRIEVNLPKDKMSRFDVTLKALLL